MNTQAEVQKMQRHLNAQGVGMTAPQKLKWAILMTAYNGNGLVAPDVSASTIDKVYEDHKSRTAGHEQVLGTIGDVEYEFRDGVPTSLPQRECSRHYESYEVAAETPDGTWVGWTFWHGGGKHSEPEAIDWIPDAYFVEMKVEMKPVRVFSVKAA